MGKINIISYPNLELARKNNYPKDILRNEISCSPSLKEFALGKTYFIKTHGCQANIRDGEIMSSLLELAGFTKANNIKEADVSIINTCAVRENAESKVYGEIGDLKSKKNKSIIAVCGCMAQEDKNVDLLLKTYSHVNLIFGTHNVHELLSLIELVIFNKKRVVKVNSAPLAIHENYPDIVREDSFKAYVNITYGCDKFCTYCIVPYTRGRERSRQMEDILNECRHLKEKGYLEITLLGQNVNAYGKDLNNGENFATLLKEVSKIGIPRVRFLTSHPWDFTSDIIDAIRDCPNVCKYIHLPVQSGDDEILKLMGRRYSQKQYLDLVKEIKTKIPDVAISTDIIVGFPNETYEQFKHTIDVCNEVEYDSAFTFIYSPRKGTPAAKIVDNVTKEEKSKRFQELVKALEPSIEKSNAKLIDKTVDVLVESISKNNDEILSGHTENMKLVNFKGDPKLIGKIVKVKILKSYLHYLLGEYVDE